LDGGGAVETGVVDVVWGGTYAAGAAGAIGLKTGSSK